MSFFCSCGCVQGFERLDPTLGTNLAGSMPASFGTRIAISPIFPLPYIEDRFYKGVGLSRPLIGESDQSVGQGGPS